MSRILLIIVALALLNSCLDNKKEVIKYNHFRKQISPSGKFVIYDYSRPGTMAFSSDIGATEIFPANKAFEEGKGQRIEGVISHWINDDTLLVYQFNSESKQLKDTFPLRTTYRKAGDFIIKSINYARSNYGGRNSYSFDSVWTTEKRIYIRFHSTRPC